MRVSIINCVSTAIEMLKFSTDAIFNNAGTEDFDYIVIKWLASPEVDDFLNADERVIKAEYLTNGELSYVANLRAMINKGFNIGYLLNDYCGLVNTDMYFGKDWLKNLVKYAAEGLIVNSTHISPIKGKHVFTANCGIPTEEIFDMDRFNQLYSILYGEGVYTEDDRGGWINTNTMPYLIHHKWWEECGPWEMEPINDTPPDRRFFERCHKAGAYFTMSRSSIVYHHEGVERRGPRPKGTEHLK